MNFNGNIIKQKAKDAGLSLLSLAEKLNVSRQAINSWMNGKVPRGHHLVELCSLLNVKPDVFFPCSTENMIKIPLHRTVRKKDVTPEMQKSSVKMAMEYLNLFKYAPAFSMVSVVRLANRSDENAKLVAEHLRGLAKIGNEKVIGYEEVFQLFEKLGIYAVFCSFPSVIAKQSYAFYTKMANQRVVFINIDTNVLDLIFQLLHETVHAIRDEDQTVINNFEEEEFCDKVAMYTQFPDYYVDMVVKIINGCKHSEQIINKLKELSADYKHSLFGIYYRLKAKNLFPEELNNIGGAATNLAKKFPTCRQILFHNPDPRFFVDVQFKLSPLFMKLVSQNISSVSVRKVAEWLGLDTTMDAQAVIEEIKKREL